MHGRPHGALRRRFERVAEIHDEGAGDGGRGQPATVSGEDFETGRGAGLVEEGEPAAGVLVRTDALGVAVRAGGVVF